MWQRLYTVAAGTFVETLRQPIYGVLLLATAILLVLNVSLAAFMMQDDNKLLLDLGLSTLMLSGLFLAAFSASAVVSREIENKTVLSVLSKPISRPVFILGKYLGLVGALAVAFYVSALVFILAQRHGVMMNTTDPWDGPVIVAGVGSLLLSFLAGAFCNYFYGSHFTTTTIGFFASLLTASMVIVAMFDARWEAIPFASDFVGGQVLFAAYLVFLIVLVTTAVALAASTRFGEVMTLVISTATLGLGIVADNAFGQYAESSALAGFAYAIVPNIGPFWVIDGLNADSLETVIPASYIAYATGYALLLVGGFLGVAVASFQQREVG